MRIQDLDPEAQDAMLDEMSRLARLDEFEDEDELDDYGDGILEEEDRLDERVPDATDYQDDWSIYIRPTGTLAYQHLLDAAEEHFLARGYASVRIHDIATKLGKKHSAIYYYAPKGKEQLYMLVMEHILKMHFGGINAAIQAADREEIYYQLESIASWLLHMRPISPIRIETLDFPLLCSDNIQKMRTWMHKALFNPIRSLLLTAMVNEEIELSDPNQAAAVFVEIIYAQRWHYADDESVTIQTVDMLLNGWLKR